MVLLCVDDLGQAFSSYSVVAFIAPKIHLTTAAATRATIASAGLFAVVAVAAAASVAAAIAFEAIAQIVQKQSQQHFQAVQSHTIFEFENQSVAIPKPCKPLQNHANIVAKPIIKQQHCADIMRNKVENHTNNIETNAKPKRKQYQHHLFMHTRM